MGECEFAPAIAGEDPRRNPLPILAKRVERDQALGGGHGLLRIAARIRMLGGFFEGAGGKIIKLTPCPLRPTIERLSQRELAEEFTSIQSHGALDVGRVGQLGKRREFVGIDTQMFGLQADLVRVDEEDVGRSLEQIPAQGNETLSQIVPRLLVAALAPEQRRQVLPARAMIRMHRQIGEQRLAFT